MTNDDRGGKKAENLITSYVNDPKIRNSFPSLFWIEKKAVPEIWIHSKNPNSFASSLLLSLSYHGHPSTDFASF